MESVPLTHLYLSTNGVRLHVVNAGPKDGPLVILLHGFPEFWYGWRKQIPVLTGSGYRVLAPDQRGYNLSDKPQGFEPYTFDKLAQDVLGLLQALGRKKAFLVGHDWGAAVAWWLATRYPDKLEKVVVINVPHPLVMQQALGSSVRQLLKSWYIFFFQLPRLPETLSRGGDWRLMCLTLTRTSRAGTFSEVNLERYREAWSQPGAYTAMLNWYRAAARYALQLSRPARVQVPTLLIWGAQDRFLSRWMAKSSVGLCDQGELVFIENATHWVQHEESERVNRLILDFFGMVPGTISSDVEAKRR